MMDAISDIGKLGKLTVGGRSWGFPICEGPSVVDIAKLYGGSLTLDESSLGGLETRLVLPAIA